MSFVRPVHVIAGFHADLPEPELPELTHLGEQWLAGAKRIGTHRHVGYEIYLQVDGAATWSGAGVVAELGPGDAFLAAPGVDHAMRGPAPGPHHFLFAGIELDATLARLGVAAAWPRGRCVQLRGAHELEAPFRLLLREAATARSHRVAALRAAIDLLAIATTRLLAASPATALLPDRHPAVDRARELLDTRCGEDWPMARLARSVGLSPSRLGQLFAAATGMPPHRYLLRRRVERAKELLVGGDLAVTRIAHQLGFASSQHFARVFRATTGRTARAWRAGSRS